MGGHKKRDPIRISCIIAAQCGERIKCLLEPSKRFDNTFHDSKRRDIGKPNGYLWDECRLVRLAKSAVHQRD
jgi:hypothetical protein